MGCKWKNDVKLKNCEKKCDFFGADPWFFCQNKRFFWREIYKLLLLCVLETIKRCRSNDGQWNGKKRLPHYSDHSGRWSSSANLRPKNALRLAFSPCQSPSWR